MAPKSQFVADLDWMQQLYRRLELSSQTYGEDVVPEGLHLQRLYTMKPHDILGKIEQADYKRKKQQAQAASQQRGRAPSRPRGSQRSKSARAASRGRRQPPEDRQEFVDFKWDNGKDLVADMNAQSLQPRTHLAAQTLCHQIGGGLLSTCFAPQRHSVIIQGRPVQVALSSKPML